MNSRTIFDITVSELDNIKESDSNFKRKEFISASPKISIKEALLLMAKNDILCLPIQSHNNPCSVVNLVNLFDILTFITHELPENTSIMGSASDRNSEKSKRRSLDSSQILNPECYRRLTYSIERVMTLDSERESYRLYTCSTYDNIQEVLVNFGKGIHRAVVTDSKGSPFHVITQMDILRHLFKNPELFPKKLCEKSVESLGLLSLTGVTFVQENSLTIDAYRTMAENRYTSVVVVDKSEGKILSNLSASSLRGLASNNLDHLILPVHEFMKKSPRGQRPLLYCSSEITLWELIKLLVTKNVHHAWFIDDKQKPYASVSPTDILKIMEDKYLEK